MFTIDSESQAWAEQLLGRLGLNPNTHKIAAIRIVRSDHSLGLKDAKDLVESIQDRFPSGEAIRSRLYRAETILQDAAQQLRAARDTYLSTHPGVTDADREFASLASMAVAAHELAERAGGAAAAGIGS